MNEFKAEIRSTVLSNNINRISGFSNRLTLNIPSSNEIRQVRDTVEERSPIEPTGNIGQDDTEDVLQREDPTLALASTRIEIERLLRKILDKRTDISPQETGRIKTAGLPSLISNFIARYPDYQYLRDAFRYVTQVCNAAIHAQVVSDDQAMEALGLGKQIIAILHRVLKEDFGPSDGEASLVGRFIQALKLPLSASRRTGRKYGHRVSRPHCHPIPLPTKCHLERSRKIRGCSCRCTPPPTLKHPSGPTPYRRSLCPPGGRT
jgi:hypothetical protein